MTDFVNRLSERLALKRHYRRLFEKELPPGVNYFYCFGGITFFLFLLLTFTGVILSLYYIPSTQEAYGSIRFIDEKLPQGWLMRSMHIWSASGMVAMVLAH